jgi:hypothetical protein
MKKLVIGAALIFVGAFSYKVVWPMLTATSCGTEHLKISHSETNLRDRVAVGMSMKSRFGKYGKYYSRYLTSAKTSMLYKTTKTNPWVSVFVSTYSDPRIAQKASRRLQSRWVSDESQQYHVEVDGQSVSLYNNHKYDSQCFFAVVSKHQGRPVEPGQVMVAHQADQTTKKPKRLKKRKLVKKKNSKARRKVAAVKKTKKSKLSKKKKRSLSKKKRISRKPSSKKLRKKSVKKGSKARKKSRVVAHKNQD